MTNIKTRKVAFAGVVGALYAALTISLGFIGYGPVQFRVAEALTVLPFFFPFSVWGLFVGCIIANLVSPYPLDIIAGPVATLLAAVCTMRIGRLGKGSAAAKILACLPPVVINAVFIGALIAYSMTGYIETNAFFAAFLINGAQVGLGQFAVLYILGLPLLILLPKMRVFEKLLSYRGD